MFQAKWGFGRQAIDVLTAEGLIAVMKLATRHISSCSHPDNIETTSKGITFALQTTILQMTG